MKKFRASVERRQLALLPASIEDYIPSDDLVRFVDLLIDELDFSAIESKYSSFGRPAYNPRVLAKIILYGKMRGIRSSRELERATQENLRFMFLANNERPDYRTIARFRSDHHLELSQLLKQTVCVGIRENLITLKDVCIDGTKLRAFAGRNSFKDPKKLAELEEALVQSLAEDIKSETEDDGDDSDDQEGSGRLPKELQSRQALQTKVREALQHYEAIEGDKPKKISLTDPQARYMKSKGSLPSYNAQLSVDADSQLAVGGFITNAGSDHSQLIPMLREIEENSGIIPKAVITDRGYGEIAGLAKLDEKGIDGYVCQRERRLFRLQGSGD